ncbi:MAG: hypothetical protein B7Y83_10680 [Flavobacteriales bacterium 32-34-25]|nr:MAG: hypothetical protein B7Y83_10680 [Flavobacteriales bacterium 32-34-25]
MIKKISMSFFVLFTSIAFAQNKSDIDSLYQVKDYLLGIRSTVNVKDWDSVKQHEKVALLYEKAKEYETQYPRWLKTVIHEESSHYSEMKRQLTLILQTLALYKSDLKTLQNKRPTNQEDLEFLNSSIPKLVDSIYYYCKLAEEERLKKIH